MERERAAPVLTDRLSTARANAAIRNAQEAWQLAAIEDWLRLRQYHPAAAGFRWDAMQPGTCSSA